MTHWINVCQSNGNLLAAGGGEMVVKVFDKRESRFIKKFDDGAHSGELLR